MLVSRMVLLVILGAFSLSFAGDNPEPPKDCPSLDLEAYAGQVVYLDFWASWCSPCRSSFPWMQSIQDRFSKDGLVLLTINVDRDRKAADKFLAGQKTTLPVIWDPDGKLAENYGLQAMPSSFIYDRSGRLVAHHLGFNPEKTGEIEKELEELLKPLAENPNVQ